MGRNFSIRLNSRRCEEVFHGFLSCLPDAGGESAGEFDIINEGDGIVAYCDDGGEIFRAGSPLAAYYLLEQAIYHRVFKIRPNDLVFHGAAIRHNPTEKVVLIIGPSLCGKTSIAFAALKTGKYAYLSEDCLLVDPTTFETIPFPRALKLRSPCADNLHGLETWKVMRVEGDSRVVIQPPATLISNNGKEACPALAIFPSYRRENRPQPRPLTRGETMACLIAQSIKEKTYFIQNGLGAFNGLSERLEAVEMAWNDADAAVGAIESFLGDPPRTHAG